MPSSRTISANGIELFVLEQGEGPLVLLCHGWPELSYSWRHQIPALADAGFHVVAPDMRGFGRSSAPAEIGAYTIFDNVGDMVALVAALGEKQAVIVGHDWGAPVAWDAAKFRPDMFTKVAGLSVPPPLRAAAGRWRASARAASPTSIGSISRPPALPKRNSSVTPHSRCGSCSGAAFPIHR
jgi:pimeloyl-ACP methyl ester carboxylesterase